jgi:hypothetical protein
MNELKFFFLRRQSCVCVFGFLFYLFFTHFVVIIVIVDNTHFSKPSPDASNNSLLTKKTQYRMNSEHVLYNKQRNEASENRYLCYFQSTQFNNMFAFNLMIDI